jgi:hypothetical protein
MMRPRRLDVKSSAELPIVPAAVDTEVYPHATKERDV